MITLNSIDFTKTFRFNKIYNENCTQTQIFEETAIPLIDHCLEGYHGVYFAYGQTGTGKTHTMGIKNSITAYSDGIIPMTLRYLFDYIEKNNSKSYKCRIHLSLYQIYLDNVEDLLNPDNKSLVIREDKNDIFIEDLIEVHVKSINQAVNIINTGLAYRKVAAQDSNFISSRSHILLNIDIYQNIVNDDHIQSVSSRLTLVDLAGSERIRKTRAKGERLKEAQSINSSLSALGNVILGLTKGEYVSFRQSKLTRILQNQLKGDSKIVIMTNISSLKDDTNETLSTLQFANRCKQILTQPSSKISIEPKQEVADLVYKEMISDLQSHYQKREEELMNHISSLERQISKSHHSLSNLNEAEGESVEEVKIETKPIGNDMQTFEIEEIVDMPQSENNNIIYLRKIQKQEDYIQYLNNLLMQVLDETSYLFAQSMTSSETPKFFRDNILRSLFQYQNLLKYGKVSFIFTPDNPIDESPEKTPLRTPRSESKDFVNETHTNLIKK